MIKIVCCKKTLTAGNQVARCRINVEIYQMLMNRAFVKYIAIIILGIIIPLRGGYW